jgi:hypothetical protein
MKHATLIAAVGVIALSNAFALIHAVRNRAGEPEAELELTDRELFYVTESDDSGVDYTLRWTDPDDLFTHDDERAAPGDRRWLDVEKLREIGFDVDTPPPSESVWSDRRLMPRTAYVALEDDGAAWRAWADRRRKRAGETDATAPGVHVEQELDAATRLMCIDADRDADTLRVRHPDRAQVLIVPCVIAVHWIPANLARDGVPATPARLDGRVEQIPTSIHVPLPFSAELRALAPTYGANGRMTPSYRVRLRYGRHLEPWVIGVEADERSAPK